MRRGTGINIDRRRDIHEYPTLSELPEDARTAPGIKKIYYRTKYDKQPKDFWKSNVALLKKCGIEVARVPYPEE